MGVDRNYLVVHLADPGDRSAVVDADAVASAGNAPVATLGAAVEDERGQGHQRMRAAHLYAVRALAALAVERPDAVPDWAGAFVEPWRNGDFETLTGPVTQCPASRTPCSSSRP